MLLAHICQVALKLQVKFQKKCYLMVFGHLWYVETLLSIFHMQQVLFYEAVDMICEITGPYFG